MITARARHRRRSARWRAQWGWPVAIALLTLLGLLLALIGEGGAAWALAWIALASPLLVILRHWPLRRLFARKLPQ